jgi:alkaline phosphatase
MLASSRADPGQRQRLSWNQRLLVLEPLESRRVLDALSLADFYTEGAGDGLAFQQLEGFGLATTYGTTVEGNTSSSALQGHPMLHDTGAAPLRNGFEFNPAFVHDDHHGNLVGWSTQRGGTAPWLIRPELVGQEGAVADLRYPGRNSPDSASTATALYTGRKTYAGAVGVDLFERPVLSILELAQQLGKATGTVSSVPISHATSAAAIAHHNLRLRRDGVFPDLENTLQQALLTAKPTVLLGGGHPLVTSDAYVRSSTLDSLRDPADGRYDDWTLVERGPDAAARLTAAAAEFVPESGRQLIGIFAARGQSGNLPWSTANGDFSNTGFSGRRDTDRPLAGGETDEMFVARELNENPRLFELANAALDVLEEDPDGFWLMIEGGDTDWAMHDNSIDNAVGTVLEFDLAVENVMNWIKDHGGFEENLLIVTADHDHYLTLNDNYPELVASRGLADLTPTAINGQSGDSKRNGHFWGPDPDDQFGWSSHTKIPVPVHYEGPDAVMAQLADSVGAGYEVYGHQVPGVRGMIDQVHIHQAMSDAFSAGSVKNVILMIGDGMGWEMVRAAAIAARLQEGTGSASDVRTFQQGVNGYRGASDTTLRQSTPFADLGDSPMVGVVQADPDARTGASHGLVRFGELFGDGPSQIPVGVTIRSAVLRLSLLNEQRGMSLHRMLQPWTDTITWNAAVGGVDANDIEASALPSGSVISSSPNTLLVDVTSSLRRWALDLAPNHGWAVLPSAPGGVVFHSAEGGVAPRLIVEFESRGKPIAHIDEILPNPRVGDVEEIAVFFNRPISGFDLSDIELTNNGGDNLLPADVTLTTSDNRTWIIGNLEGLTNQPGTYELILRAADSGIVDRHGNSLREDAATSWRDIRQAGDANTDRVFDQLDVIQVLQAGPLYLSGLPASWAEGDWNGDGVFNQWDIVAAMQTGNYLSGPVV